MAKKMIVIPHTGPIYPKGGVYGPITTPYAEDVVNIGTLLFGGYAVEEVLENGKRVKLNLGNFDKDNTPKVKEPAKQEEPKVEDDAAPVQTQQQEKKVEAKQQGGKNKHQGNKNRFAADEVEKK